MAWTSADLATLDAAIASGVLKVKYSDRELEYQSMANLLVARTEIVNFLSQTSGPPQVRMVQIYTKNGW